MLSNTRFSRFTSATYCSNLSDFYLEGHFKTVVHLAPIENEERLHQIIFVASKAIWNRPVTLKLCDCPWSGKSMSAFIQVDDTLNIRCELWRDKQK
jgi:hypothetical protein